MRVKTEGSQYLEIEEVEGEVEVMYEVSADVIYAPARLGGSVETDHPDESEIRDIEVVITGVYDGEGEEIRASPRKEKSLIVMLDAGVLEEQLCEAWGEERDGGGDV